VNVPDAKRAQDFLRAQAHLRKPQCELIPELLLPEKQAAFPTALITDEANEFAERRGPSKAFESGPDFDDVHNARLNPIACAFMRFGRPFAGFCVSRFPSSKTWLCALEHAFLFRAKQRGARQASLISLEGSGARVDQLGMGSARTAQVILSHRGVSLVCV
jgi:hypothetical protein